jgi:hypothetical protein
MFVSGTIPSRNRKGMVGENTGNRHSASGGQKDKIRRDEVMA